MGFKEIEVGFPSASQPDFDFLRQLIEEDLIPDDVLDPSPRAVSTRTDRAHLSKACAAPASDRALLQLDQPTQREVVFGLDQAGIKDVALTGAQLCKEQEALLPLIPTARRHKFATSTRPESFTLTEPEFAIEVCEAVMECHRADPDRPDDPQPAGNGRVLLAQRLRRRDRVVRTFDFTTATR